MVCAEGGILDFGLSTLLVKDVLKRWVEMESSSWINNSILMISNIGECYLG